MRKEFVVKILVLGIICLFIGIGVQPAFAKNNNILVGSRKQQIENNSIFQLNSITNLVKSEGTAIFCLVEASFEQCLGLVDPKPGEMFPYLVYEARYDGYISLKPIIGILTDEVYVSDPGLMFLQMVCCMIISFEYRSWNYWIYDCKIKAIALIATAF